MEITVHLSWVLSFLVNIIVMFTAGTITERLGSGSGFHA